MSRILFAILCAVALCSAAAADPINNPNSFWTQNLSNGDNRNPAYWQDDQPEIAGIGSNVHVMWITTEYDSFGHNSAFIAVYYRRSRDNGKTFDPAVRVYAQASSSTNPMIEDPTLHHMAVDNNSVVHIGVLLN